MTRTQQSAMITLFAMLAAVTAYPQSSDTLYRLRLKADIPLMVGGAAWSLDNFSQISKKSNSSISEVEALSTADVNWFDRWAIHPYNQNADRLSDVPFYAAIPLPLIVSAIDPRLRPHYATVTVLYVESMILTGVLYTSAVRFVDRHRPLVYESASPLGKRVASTSRNSFFSGHVALVGTSMFFIARTHADAHPDDPYRWVWWAGAEGVTALTAYLRNRAGEHFITDIALGNLVGFASGNFVPLLHRVRIKGQPVTITPWTGGGAGGLTFMYHFK